MNKAVLERLQCCGQDGTDRDQDLTKTGEYRDPDKEFSFLLSSVTLLAKSWSKPPSPPCPRISENPQSPR